MIKIISAKVLYIYKQKNEQIIRHKFKNLTIYIYKNENTNREILNNKHIKQALTYSSVLILTVFKVLKT